MIVKFGKPKIKDPKIGSFNTEIVYPFSGDSEVHVHVTTSLLLKLKLPHDVLTDDVILREDFVPDSRIGEGEKLVRNLFPFVKEELVKRYANNRALLHDIHWNTDTFLFVIDVKELDDESLEKVEGAVLDLIKRN